MTFINQNYLNRKLAELETFKTKIKEVICFYEEYVEVAEGCKAVLKTFDGKKPNKRIDTALKTFNEHLCFSPYQYTPGEWTLTYYKTHSNQEDVFNYFKIDGVVKYEDMETAINKRIESKKEKIAELKNFLKNPKSKIEKLYKLADEFNAVYDSIPYEARGIMSIKHVFVYL